MDLAKVVMHVMERDCCRMVLKLFAEGIGQPRKPAHVHPHGEILPFHVRRGDMISVRIAADDLGFNIDALPAGE